MTIADDLRAAAYKLLRSSVFDSDDWKLGSRLNAHADTIERVEREIDAACAVPQELAIDDLHEWCDALRGDSNGK